MKFCGIVWALAICGVFGNVRAADAQSGGSPADALDKIVIRLTNKEGAAWKGRNVVFEMTGVSVDQEERKRNLLPGVSATGRTLETDDEGKIEIPLPKLLTERDQSVLDYLNQSRKMTLLLTPQLKTGEPPLAPVKIDLLLGSMPQNLRIVAMIAGARKVLTVEGYAYESGQGRFHLLGRLGTALYRDPDSGAWNLAELRRYHVDDRFLYYRDVDNWSRRWAFSQEATCAHIGGRGRCYVRNCRTIWFYDGIKPNPKWEVFSCATRIDTQPRVVEIPVKE